MRDGISAGQSATTTIQTADWPELLVTAWRHPSLRLPADTCSQRRSGRARRLCDCRWRLRWPCHRHSSCGRRAGCPHRASGGEVPGLGASGRNAGLLSHPPAQIWLASATHNEEHAWGLLHLNERVRSLARWLESEAPGAEVSPAVLLMKSQGRLVSAGLSHVAGILANAKVPHATGRSALAHLFVHMETSTINPYLTVRALGRAARLRGVPIREGVSVAPIEEAGDGAALTLADGRRIQARSAVV